MEKIAKIKDLGLPKPSQNPFKMAPKTMSQQTCDFSIDFCPILDACREGRPLIFAGRAIVLLAFHTIRCFAFCMPFGSKKPTENLSKMRSEPFKNRCQKCVVF